MNKNRFFLLALLGVLMAFAPACNTDPCKDVNCGANGTCVDGSCFCDDGYEGASCETEWAEKFVGSYLGRDICKSGTYNLTKPAVVSKRNAKEVRMSNFGGFDSFLDMDVTKSDELSFTNKTDPAGRRFTGTAKLSNNRLTGNYIVTYSDNTRDTCTCEYNKQ